MANITYTITQDGDEISYTINDGVGPVGPAGPNNITTSTETDITGILKGDGANVSAAVEDTDYQGVPAEGAFTDGDKTKLDGIEAGADVTDAANVNAAGAVMESDYSPAHSVLAQQSGTGSPSAVSLGTNSLLGRASGAGTDITGLTAAQARTLLNVEDGATADQTAAEILTAIKTVDGTGSGLDADLLDGQDSSAFATSAQGALADSAVQPGDIDTLAELNAIVTDATLIDTTDSRLSDARTPTAHTHTVEDLDFAGSTEIGADLADADEILVSDGGGNTTRRKSLVSRIWTYIKAKIDAGVTWAGNQTFSGQVEATGQAASTDDSVMTRSLGDARYAVTLTSYKTANEDKANDTTRADDSELALSLEASSTYIFEIILPYWCLDGTVTQGIDFGVSVPTGSSIIGHYDVAVSDSWQYRGRRFTQTTTRAVNTGNGSGEAQVRIFGTIKTSTTAGTFAPQWAQASSSANRTRVSYGAYMIAHKIQ